MSLSIKGKLVPIAKEICRELRKNSTLSERIFWEEVRERRFLGLKFYRQFPIFVDDDGKETFFVADFFCHQKRLVIEIDGKIHEYQKDHDKLREQLIRGKGIRVKRFRNDEVERDIHGVMMRLKDWMTVDKAELTPNPSLEKRGEYGNPRSNPLLFPREGAGG